MEQDVSDLIGYIYEAALLPDLWPDVLRRISVYTPSALATLYSHDRIARAPTFQRSYGINPDYLAQYIERWAASNPINDAMASLNPGEVAGLPSVMDYEAFTKSEFFLQWGRPQGYCDAINVMLERTSTRVASLSLIRADEHGMADDATIGRLKLIAPHVLRAVKIGRIFHHEAVQNARLEQMIDTLRGAIFMLDESGKFIRLNQDAKSLVERGLVLTNFRKKPKLNDRIQTLDHWHKIYDDIAILSTNDGVSHVSHFLPMKFKSMLITLAVIHSTSVTELTVAKAKTLFSLTPRERDVLFGVLEIGGVPAIAAALDISRETVRAHMKALFRKTGTNRQADLVKLMGTLESPFNPAVLASSD